MRALFLAVLLAGAAMSAGAHEASAQQILPTTSTTAPVLTTTTTEAVAPTTTVPVPTTVRRTATTVRPTTSTEPKPTTTASTFVPPEGQNGPTTTVTPRPTKEAGGAVLPLLVTLSVGGFALALLIMGAQFVATRPRRPPTK